MSDHSNQDGSDRRGAVGATGTPDAFAIDVPVTTASVRAGETVDLELNITNALGRRVRTGIEVRPHDDETAAAEWIELQPTSFDLDINESQRVAMRVAPPAEATQGDHRVTLRAYDVDRPADAFTVSPPITVGVATQPDAGTPWWVLALVGLILLAIVGVIVWFLFLRGTEVADVVGSGVGAAREELEDSGLDPVVVDDGSAEPMAAGCVLLQHPAAGSDLNEGGTVALLATACPSGSPNPQLSAQAQALRADGFAGLCGVVPDFCDAVRDASADGDVLQGDVPSDQLAARFSQMVDAFLAEFTTEGEPVTVEQVIGLPFGEASNALSSAGLAVEATGDGSVAPVDEGCVLLQHPPGSSEAQQGSAVAVVVSACPAESQDPALASETRNLVDGNFATLCNVAGPFCDAVRAEPRLEGQAFNGNTPTQALIDELSAMVEQYRLAFTIDPELPNLRGQFLSNAKQTADELGLTVATEPEQFSHTCPKVGDQVPDPGTPVSGIRDVLNGVIRLELDFPNIFCFPAPNREELFEDLNVLDQAQQRVLEEQLRPGGDRLTP